MGKLVKLWNVICSYKYWIVSAGFLVILFFVDENNLVRRFQYYCEIKALESEIEHYRSLFERDTKRLDALESGPEGIEKVARERYLMKASNEDIYIFEED